MRTKMCSTLLIISALLASSVPVSAQHLVLTSSSGGGGARTASIDELREDIRGLEVAMSGPSASSAEREGSSAVLQERRVQLYGLLRKRVNALRAYYGTVTSEPERAALEKDIQKRLGELRELEQDIYKDSAGNLYSRSAPVAVTQPLSVASVPASPSPQAKSKRTWVQREIDEAVKEIMDAPDDSTRSGKADLFSSKSKLVVYTLATDLAVKEALDNAEEARVDKEMGGGDENAGGTSLVSKGATPAILGFAVQNGALTQSADGTKISFRGNLVGIVEALRNQGFLESYRDDSPGTRQLRKFSFGFTFDTSRGDTPDTFLANKQQLASYTFRYEFINDRDPRDPRYAERWKALADADFQDALNEISSMALNDQALTDWSDEGVNSIKAVVTAGGSREQVEQEVRKRLALLPELYGKLPSTTQDKVKGFVEKYEGFLKSRKNLLKVISKGPLLTFEFKGDRRPDLIDTSNFKIIAEGDVLSHFGVPEGRTELTYNGSMTVFNSTPGSGMKRLRDFDHALQLDVPFIVKDLGSFVFSFAGKYKRISEDEMMTGGTPASGAMVAAKGDIFLLQGKLQIPLKGFRIPLSVSYANRTDLIKEREVRGNIGFTFDLDPFYAYLRK